MFVTVNKRNVVLVSTFFKKKKKKRKDLVFLLYTMLYEALNLGGHNIGLVLISHMLEYIGSNSSQVKKM